MSSCWGRECSFVWAPWETFPLPSSSSEHLSRHSICFKPDLTCLTLSWQENMKVTCISFSAIYDTTTIQDFFGYFFCENNKKERKKPKTRRKKKKKKTQVDLMFLQCFPILKDNIIHNLCMATTNEKQLIHRQWLATKWLNVTTISEKTFELPFAQGHL